MNRDQFNLVLILNPVCGERWDFELVGQYVREIAPDVHTTVLDDRAIDLADLPRGFEYPTLTFSPAPLRRFKAPRGPVFQGMPLGKSEEYRALERIGVEIPRWTVLTRTCTPDLSAFGSYVVVKPDRGGRGADVKIKRKGRVRWSAPRTHLAAKWAASECDWIVQEFIYTGPHPSSYRVTSLFGEPLWAWKVEADPCRRPLQHRDDFQGGDDGGGKSIVSSGRGCRFTLVRDDELFAIARRVHQAFPDIGLIGVDIIRDADTGRLWVIEANSAGMTWHLTSPTGSRIQREFSFDLDAAFDVRRNTARILAARAKQYAC